MVAQYRAWADKARECFGTIEKIQIGPTRLDFRAFFQIPASWSEKKKMQMAGTPHLQHPDLDNVLKSINDALFLNDQVVYSVRGEKIWTLTNPRVEVVVY